MNRDLSQFQSEVYDLIIVGGGIYGATICWEAVSRGLKVALFEKSDFGSATSANSLKTIHGGFRYIQNLDLNRVKESIREQKTLMYIAPHLVYSLPVLVPIYGHGLKGKEAFSAGLWLFNSLRSSEDQLGDPDKHIPPSRLITKGECLELLPSLHQKGLNGGALFFDAQVFNSERLVISFLHSAWQQGGHVANYSEAVGFQKNAQRVWDVKVKDVLTGDVFQATSRIIVLACGPWNESLLNLIRGTEKEKTAQYAKAVNLVTKKLFDKYAVGFLGKNQHLNGKPIKRAKNSYLFVAPWRDYSIIGTAYSVSDRNADSLQINEKDITFLKNEFNRVNPRAKLSNRDILFVHRGLLPVSKKTEEGQSLHLTNKFEMVDYSNFGFDGLLSVEGVKYTTARSVAQKTIDYLLEKWDYKFVPSTSSNTRLIGGDITRFGDFLSEAEKQNQNNMSEKQIRSLVFNFGSIYPEVLKYLDDPSYKSIDGNQDLTLLAAQIRFSVDHEMAQKLGDVVFRRTELGSASHPGNAALEYSAKVMGREMSWSQSRIDEELAGVQKEFPQFQFEINDQHRERVGDQAFQ